MADLLIRQRDPRSFEVRKSVRPAVDAGGALVGGDIDPATGFEITPTEENR